MLHASVKSIAQDAFDTDSLVAGELAPKLVAKQFSFTEGPAVDKQGNIFFTDQPNDKIWKYDTDGKLTVFMDKAGRSNGLYFDKKGNIISFRCSNVLDLQQTAADSGQQHSVVRPYVLNDPVSSVPRLLVHSSRNGGETKQHCWNLYLRSFCE